MNVTELENFKRDTENEQLIKLDDFKAKILPDFKASVDPEYLQKIKKKVEKLLSKIFKTYNIEKYMSDKFRCRLDYDKLYSSEYYKLFEDKKDINGKQLRYGHEYIPEDFEDWIKVNIPYYFEVEQIYTSMCSTRRITKEDLILLNKIAKKYKVTQNDSAISSNE